MKTKNQQQTLLPYLTKIQTITEGVGELNQINANYYTHNGVTKSIFDFSDDGLSEDDWLLRYETIRMLHELQSKENKSFVKFQLINEETIGQACVCLIALLLVFSAGLVGFKISQTLQNTQIEVNR